MVAEMLAFRGIEGSHETINNFFLLPRRRMTATDHRADRSRAFEAWRGTTFATSNSPHSLHHPLFAAKLVQFPAPAQQVDGARRSTRSAALGDWIAVKIGIVLLTHA